MDLFQNKIDPKKFRYTNALWNELQLNHPMSVGYVTTLIESKNFQTKEEWRDFYYRSGQTRLALAKEKGITLASNNSQAKALNGNYGRTEEELRIKGRIMYEALQERGNPLQITLAECVYMVKFRVMGETWNGVIMRERNTIKTLQQHFPHCTFRKVSGEDDFRYAIDYEIYLHNTLMCAVQIKPLSYQKGFSQEIQKAKKANNLKNKHYTDKFGKEVLYVYSNNKGDILNPEILQNIQSSLLTLQKAV